MEIDYLGLFISTTIFYTLTALFGLPIPNFSRTKQLKTVLQSKLGDSTPKIRRIK
jgi:hypothetical protein